MYHRSSKKNFVDDLKSEKKRVLVDHLKENQSLKTALDIIGIKKSTYFYRKKNRYKKRKAYRLDPELCEVLKSLQGYELTLGYRKTTEYIRKRHKKNWNKKKVYRHMKKLKLLQPKKIKRRKHPNTRLAKCCAIRSNVRWEADLTYVRYAGGYAYLFIVEDVYDKEIVGEHISYRSRADEAVSSLKKAVYNRFNGIKPKGLELVIRVDRGCQYTSQPFYDFCNSEEIKLEFCGVQTPNDKPYVESFIGCYKREEVYRNDYQNFLEVCQGWGKYLQWYHESRPHGSLNLLSPAEFKKQSKSSLIVVNF